MRCTRMSQGLLQDCVAPECESFLSYSFFLSGSGTCASIGWWACAKNQADLDGRPPQVAEGTAPLNTVVSTSCCLDTSTASGFSYSPLCCFCRPGGLMISLAASEVNGDESYDRCALVLFSSRRPTSRALCWRARSPWSVNFLCTCRRRHAYSEHKSFPLPLTFCNLPTACIL